MTNIIAIANQKGGVGKSTISLNIGGTLAEQGEKTLLIDMDQQGNLSSVFVENIFSLKFTIADLLLNGEISPNSVIQSTQISNLFILPSNLSLGDLDVQLAGDYDAQYLLSEIIDTPSLKDFEYILIDCPPNLGMATRMALVAAQAVIIPIEAQEWAIKGSKQILAFIDKVRKRANPDLKVYGFIINKMKNRNIEKSYRDFLREAYPNKVFKTELRDNVQYVEATTERKPVTFYLPRSEQAEAYRNLVKEIFNV
jgi:chromosome partitioning protein